MASKKKTVKKVTKKAPAKKPVKAPKKPAAKKLTKKPKAVKVTAKPLKTYVAMILDESSSMGVIKAETIQHFNEQVEQIVKDSAGMDTRVSLTVFGSEVTSVFFDESLDKLQPLTARNYNPNGMTAMYDGIGETIDRMRKEIKDIDDKDVAILMVIVSDGQENNSKKYKQTDIAERIKHLQGTKRWTFTYLGANQDLSVVSAALNIPAGNMLAFVADSSGMNAASASHAKSLGTYMTSRRSGSTQSHDFYSK